MTTTDELARVADRWRRAEVNWAEYQRTHDVTPHDGQAVGVDLDSGEVFFGPSPGVISARLAADGQPRSLWFTVVGRLPVRHHTSMRRLR